MCGSSFPLPPNDAVARSQPSLRREQLDVPMFLGRQTSRRGRALKRERRPIQIRHQQRDRRSRPSSSRRSASDFGAVHADIKRRR